MGSSPRAPKGPKLDGDATGLLGLGRFMWNRLTSMRTAVILLGLLGLAAVPGSLLPQRGVASNPSSVPIFMADHPTVSPWLDRLGLFEVYAAPWFAAIYLLLLVSMTGCVIPRCLRLWREIRAEPRPSPRHLAGLATYRSGHVDDPEGALDRAAAVLRSHRFRVVREGDQVRAEKGYLREAGNLVFHLSLLILLLGVATGRIFGFEGRVALVEGTSFTNVRANYDAFTPSAWTDVDGLEPVTLTLDRFEAEFELMGSRQGEPRAFRAELTVQTPSEAEPRTTVVRPNEPLNVDDTKFFLTGHGYALDVTVRDGRGDIAFRGPVIFLPMDGNLASDGVVKAPDARPDGLGFQGTFLPSAVIGDNGPTSVFPDLLYPQLFVTAFEGDLGLGDGVPQSVFDLDTTDMTQLQQEDGTPVRAALGIGQTMKLPDGKGSLRLDDVRRFANFQIAYDPGKEISLVAAILLLAGLTISLLTARRRVWVRVRDGSSLEIAGQGLSRRDLTERDVAIVADQIMTKVPKSKDAIR